MHGNYPILKGMNYETFNVIADDATPTVPGQNVIPAGAKSVECVGVQNDANDWIELPSLEKVQDGHVITLVANAGANFECRTPASSNQKINGQDSDGTKELLVTDQTIVTITKFSNSVGWVSVVTTALGAFGTAVVPD